MYSYIHLHWDNIKKIDKSNITAELLESKLKILHSYWERMDNVNAALVIMEGIKSTNYYDYIENAYLRITEERLYRECLLGSNWQHRKAYSGSGAPNP